MKLLDLLKEYGSQKKIGPLQLDDQDTCRLLLDQSTVISLENSMDGEGFYIYAPVFIGAPEIVESLGLEALSGNLFGRETGSASLGWHPESQQLILFQYLKTDLLDSTLFEKTMDSFIERLHYWSEKFEEESWESPEEFSMERHFESLPHHEEMKIFFA